jgi:hypothetical protein
VRNDNYNSFLATVTFPHRFGCLSARLFGVFLGWFSAFAGAGFRPPGGRRPKAGASVAPGGILRGLIVAVVADSYGCGSLRFVALGPVTLAVKFKEDRVMNQYIDGTWSHAAAPRGLVREISIPG